MAADHDPDPLAVAPPIPTERHGYAPPSGPRVLAFVGTSFLYVLMAAGLFRSFEVGAPPSKPSALLVVSLHPLASPPEAPPRPKEVPKPVEKHEKRPAPPRVEPVEPMIVPLPAITAPPPSPAVKPADPASPQPETAAPRTAPAPTAPQASSNGADTWEGRVLARLEKFRRYPGAARSGRQQGVVYVRFRIRRDGRVLSSSLVRSSGYPLLDQAALETLRRADPLPTIPAGRPDEIELSVPMEFYMR